MVTEKSLRTLEKYFEKPTRLKTWSGIPVKDVYTPDDIEATEYQKDLGDPGQFPYTRGIMPGMYRGRLWSIRELTGASSPRETNKRLKYLLLEGETGLAPIGDVTGNLGIDSDHPRARGAVGMQGVPMCSLRDMEILMDGIPLDQVSVSLLLPTPAYAFYIALVQSQGLDLSKLRGTMPCKGINAPLAGTLPEYLDRESYPVGIWLRLTTDTLLFLQKNLPRFYALNIGPEGLRESGATPAQEIAIDFCIALAHVKDTIRRGATADEILPKVTFTHRCGIDIFEEAAKFRAARRVWARLLREEFGTEDPRSLTYKVHVVTMGTPLVRQQPLNNIIRVAYEALAAILGGVQSMHTMSYDEPLSLPTEESSRIAVRTQQILCYETGVVNVADPLGGSYYVEWLTNKLEEEIIQLVDELKDDIVPAIESGRLIRQFEGQASEYQREVESGERVVVGANRFITAEQEDREIKVHEVNEEAVREHMDNLKELRRTRDNRKVRKCLEQVREVAEDSDENLYPAMIEAAKTYCTVWEVSGVIRMAYGLEYDVFGMLEYPFK